jgi:hypothetical protein
MSALFTQAQLAQLLENGRRQAAVKGTAGEIDFWPVVKVFTPNARCAKSPRADRNVRIGNREPTYVMTNILPRANRTT